MQMECISCTWIQKIHGSPDPDGGTHYESTGFPDACKMVRMGGMGMAIRQAGEQMRYTDLI